MVVGTSVCRETHDKEQGIHFYDCSVGDAVRPVKHFVHVNLYQSYIIGYFIFFYYEILGGYHRTLPRRTHSHTSDNFTEMNCLQ